jgi:hypothetical protein
MPGASSDCTATAPFLSTRPRRPAAEKSLARPRHAIPAQSSWTFWPKAWLPSLPDARSTSSPTMSRLTKRRATAAFACRLASFSRRSSEDGRCPPGEPPASLALAMVADLLADPEEDLDAAAAQDDAKSEPLQVIKELFPVLFCTSINPVFCKSFKAPFFRVRKIPNSSKLSLVSFTGFSPNLRKQSLWRVHTTIMAPAPLRSLPSASTSSAGMM